MAAASSDDDARLEHGSVRYLHPERFDAGSRSSLAHLHEHGYVVIRNALSNEEVSRTLDLTWSYLESLGTGIRRDDVETWGDERWPLMVDGAIIPGLGIGQSEAQWFVRSRPAVKKAFAAVWGTDDLLVSFDGMCLWRPWHIRPEWKTRGGWLHVDQHPIGRPGMQCIQGLVNLLPMSSNIGGNVLVPGSHKDHAQIPTKYSSRLQKIATEVDHFRYPANDPLISGPSTVHLEPGDLLLWDSRTIHCSGPGEGHSEAEPRLVRAVSLVCMMPRSRTSSDVLEQRKAAPAGLVSTTNWTDRFVSTDANYPQLSKGDRSKYKLPAVPVLDTAQLRLVGYSDEEISKLSSHTTSRL